METHNKKFPSQLRVLRVIRGLTLSGLGEAIGHCPSWVSRAERGLPGLAFFVWWAAAVFAAALREARHAAGAGPAWAAAGALAAFAAVFVAGLFEYNLGDSEVLMLVLLLTAVPFGLARERGLAAAA